jgi:hypothetical protein
LSWILEGMREGVRLSMQLTFLVAVFLLSALCLGLLLRFVFSRIIASDPKATSTEERSAGAALSRPAHCLVFDSLSGDDRPSQVETLRDRGTTSNQRLRRIQEEKLKP